MRREARTSSWPHRPQRGAGAAAGREREGGGERDDGGGSTHDDDGDDGGGAADELSHPEAEVRHREHHGALNGELAGDPVDVDKTSNCQLGGWHPIYSLSLVDFLFQFLFILYINLIFLCVSYTLFVFL